MTPLTVTHDLHIGTMRGAGTTLKSAQDLRTFALKKLGDILDKTHTDLAVLGDLFDSFQIPLSDAYETMRLFSEWLKRGHHLTLIPGNHDLSNDSSKMSTFEFMSRTLAGVSDRVKYLQGSGWVTEGVWAISHVPNQDLFDLELSRVPVCKFLLLHCNYDNGFAKESDHSLNLSAEAASKLQASQIIIAHEHSPATHSADRIIIPGNQFPMSISDCLDKQDKHMVCLSDEGVQRIKTWDRGDYAEIDWRDVAEYSGDARFVRVVGQATHEEAVQAIDAVAKLRKSSEAFIVGSGVKTGVTGEAIDMEGVLSSVEDIKSFDVMGALKEILSEEQVKVLEGLK